MANRYDKMTPEQRKHWNEYTNKYAKENFRSFNVKFKRGADQDVINYLETHGSVTDTMRRLVQEEIKRESGK